MALRPITTYARMWPREVFNCKVGKRLVVKDLKLLAEPGVYILYRDDVPYYVGKATKLRSRLWTHANKPGGRYYNFWNFFSVFVVKDPTVRSQIEGILIAAMPTANGARPRIPRANLPTSLRRQLHDLSQQQLQLKTRAAGMGV